jgi:hypothetical protein
MKKKIVFGVLAVVAIVGLAFTPYIVGQVSVANRIKQLFVQEYQSGNIEPSVQQAIGNGSDAVAAARFKQQLEETWTSAEAQNNYEAIVAMWRQEGDQALDMRFDAVDPQILWWEGSSEVNGVLTAKFIGTVNITMDGLTSNGGCVDEYTIVMKKNSPSGDWLLDQRTAKELFPCH